MKISILDPGLADLRGHHFDLDLRLVRALVGRGHEVGVYGHAKPVPELNQAAQDAGFLVHPTFRVSTYQRPPEGLPAYEAYGAFIPVTADDLSRVPPADVWFWPTLAPYQLMAALSASRSACQLGGVWWSPRYPIPIAARWWAQAASRMVQTPSAFTVGAYDKWAREHHRSFSHGLDITLAPTPCDASTRERRSGSLQRVGFFGHQRLDRGVDLVPQLVDALLGRGFEVVVQDSGGWIKQAARNSKLLTLPFVADFAAELAKCDLVVSPSRWEAYVANPSGVVNDCIASGVPVVLPSGCVPADIAVRFGCGVFFHDHSAEAILEAVDDAAQRFPELLVQAEKAARGWRAVNGTERLVDWIERHARRHGLSSEKRRRNASDVRRVR